MKTNNTNNFAKRTERTVKSILKANNVTFEQCTNEGDGNLFSITGKDCNTIQNKMRLKKAGFLRDESFGNTIYFKCYE